MFPQIHRRRVGRLAGEIAMARPSPCTIGRSAAAMVPSNTGVTFVARLFRKSLRVA